STNGGGERVREREGRGRGGRGAERGGGGRSAPRAGARRGLAGHLTKGREVNMQGGLIAVAVAPHAPRLGVEERVPAFQTGLIDGLKQLGQALRGLRPDLFVVNSAHWVTTFNWYATVQETHRGVCVADEAPDLMPGTPYERKGDPAFARAFVEELRAAGIPTLPNDSPHYQWDYAALVPLLYLDPDA